MIHFYTTLSGNERTAWAFLLVLKLCLYSRTECEYIAQQERGNKSVSPLYVAGEGGALFGPRL